MKITEDKINKIIGLKEDGKSFHYIMKEVGCTKNTIIKYLKLYTNYKPYIPVKLNDDLKKKIQDRYNEIGNIKVVAKEFNMSYERLSKFIILRNKIKSNKLKDTYDYRQKVKKKLIDYKGGKCQICGYNKCMAALEFHHLDPNEKDFSISGGTKSFEHSKSEVDKCILVCANCHREIHAGLININNFISNELGVQVPQ